MVKSYEELSQAAGIGNSSDINLTSAANTAFAIKKYSDITAIASFFLLPVLGISAFGLLVPAALTSLVAGVAAAAVTSKRGNGTGAEKKDDSEDVKSYRASFREAADGTVRKQAVSSALIGAAPFMLFFGFAYVFSQGTRGGSETAGIIAMALSPVAMLLGGALGFAARNGNKKMNVYEGAIKNAQQTSPPAP